MKSFFQNKYFPVLLILCLAVFSIFFLRHTDKKPFGGTARSLTSPAARFFSSSGAWFADKFSFFRSIGNLKRENKEVLEENLRLQSELAQLKDLERENQELRSQLELAPKDKYELESAMVIGRDISGQQEIISISKGSHQGLQKGMAVVIGQGTLVGKVKEVSAFSASVELLTNKSFKVSAEILEAGARGIVQGQYGTALVMDMIPQNIEISPGQSIVTSGSGQLLPRGLLIGYVKEPEATEDKLFQKTSVTIPVRLDSLRMVWVVKKEK